MDLERNVGGRDRLARVLLALLLTAVAVRAGSSGKPTLGLIAGLGAVGLGFNAVTCFCGLNKALGIDTTDD